MLAAITSFEIAVLVILATLRQNGPQSAVVVGWSRGELIIDMALVGIAAMSIGLLVSAFSTSTDQALTLLPVLISIQLILATGGIHPDIVDKPVLKQLSYGVSAQWGYAAAASTVDLNGLQEVNNRLRNVSEVNVNDPQKVERALAAPARGNPRWDHRIGAWIADVAALLALALAALIATGLVLIRRDPGRSP